jgi:hypothetical protein
MRPALSDRDPLDGRITNQAGITCALVNTEKILKIASTVDPIDAGALAIDSILQHLPDAEP